MRLMRLEREDLQEVIGLIQTLHPRPGSLVAASEPEYVIPDVYVRKNNGVWQVELNPDAFPKLRVNNHYASLIRRADNSTDNNTLKTHLQEARWFIKSLKSRSETLLKVATCIVQRQQGFLEHGEEAMKPMVLHDVAETVEHARIHHLAGDDEQVHAHAARYFRVEVLLLQPRVHEERCRVFVNRHSRAAEEADRGRKSAQALERQQARHHPLRSGNQRGAQDRGQVPRVHVHPLFDGSQATVVNPLPWLPESHGNTEWGFVASGRRAKRQFSASGR